MDNKYQNRNFEMLRARYKSLITEFIVVIGVGFLLLTVVFLLFSTVIYRNNAQKTAHQQAVASTGLLVKQTESQLQASLSVACTMAQTFTIVRSHKEHIQSVLQNVLEHNQNFDGTFSIWDSKEMFIVDSIAIRERGYDKLGRFTPYWSKDKTGNTHLSAIQNYDTGDMAAFYEKPKKMLRPAVIDPIQHPVADELKTVIPVVAPIRRDFTFYGVAGAFLPVELFQKIIDAQNYFSHQASVIIYSNDGTVVAATDQSSLLGKNIKEFHPNSIAKLRTITQAADSVAVLHNQLHIMKPVYAGNLKSPWQISVSIPLPVFYAAIYKQINRMLLFSCIALGLSIFLVVIYVRSILKPLKKLVRESKKMAAGRFDIQRVSRNKDEIGQLDNIFTDISNSLRDIASVTNAIANEDYSRKVNPRSDNDQLAIALNRMIDVLKQTRAENERQKQQENIRNWVQEGIAKFATILRQNTGDISKLTYRVITDLVGYLDANQGGLFLYNDSDTENAYLELAASYAYSRQKFLSKKIYPGDGLVGACLYEKRTIHLNEIPENYIEITSGFGRAKPNSLLITPLMHENNLLGIIEVASLKDFKHHEIAFIEQISESIASTLSVMKINSQTTELLNQTRQQAKELTAKEKEMLKNLSNLEEERQKSAKQEMEMRGVLGAIKATTLVAEYDMDGNIIDINDKFLQLFHKTRQQMIGINHRKLTRMANDPQRFDAFWKDLRKGIKKIKQGHVTLPDGDEIWFTENFTPIANEEGKPYKVINIAVDITDRKEAEEKVREKEEALVAKEKEIETVMEQMLQTQQKLMKEEENLSGTINAIDKILIRVEYNLNGDLLYANKRYLETMGYTMSEIEGRNIRMSVPKESLERFEESWKRICSGEIETDVVTSKTKDGRQIKLLVADTPVFDKKGKIYKVLLIAMNISNL